MGTPAEWEVHAALLNVSNQRKDFYSDTQISWSRRKKVSSRGSFSPQRANTPRRDTHSNPPDLAICPAERRRNPSPSPKRTRSWRTRCVPAHPRPFHNSQITRHGPGRQPPREIAEPTPLRPREGRRTDVADSLSSVGSTTVTLRGAISREASPRSGTWPRASPNYLSIS